MNVFGMVSTAASRQYTAVALKTFYENTPLAPDDILFLIDNDRSLNGIDAQFPLAKVIHNSSPRSFAANVNQTMEIARGSKANLFFLNNDIVFTRGWIEPMFIDDLAILSPLSNREVQYEVNGYSCGVTMDISDYIGRESIIAEIAQRHRDRAGAYQQVASLPFFCVKIPYSVYSVVGELDETFGRGGAEDNDYCLRASLSGFRIAYASSSYVIHFNGKSTWSGAETAEQTEERCSQFRAVFEHKWGRDLLRLLIEHDSSVINDNQAVEAAARAGNFKEMFEIILSLRPKI